MNEVKISVKTGETCPIDKLIPFQGKLKRGDEEGTRRLRASLEKYGIFMPFFVWENDGEFLVWNGHGRLSCLHQMRRDGWSIHDVPVVFITAGTRVQAKQLLIAKEADYGRRVSPGGLAEFLAIDSLDESFAEIDFVDMDNFDILREDIKKCIDNPKEKPMLMPAAQLAVFVAMPMSMAKEYAALLKTLNDMPGAEVIASTLYDTEVDSEIDDI